jgi:tetratricopeptide (TPR) repeat protein
VRRAAACLFLVLCLASIFTLHQGLWALSADEQYPFRSYIVPSSNEMKILSLGYRHFWADLIYIWSLLYYDYYNKEVRFTYFERTFEVMTDLDPRNREAYVVSALFAFMGGRYDLLYRFLDKGIAAMPEDSIPPFEAATYALFSEKNMGRAATYFAIAAERDPGNRLFKKFLAQALASKGETAAARAYWREIYETCRKGVSPEDAYYRGTALRNLWDLKVKEDILTLDRAVNAYEARHGHYPQAPEALLRDGLLPAIPLDPAGKPYSFDPKSGMVDCRSKFDFKAAYGGW